MRRQAPRGCVMLEGEGPGPGFGATRDVVRTIERMVMGRTSAVVVVPGTGGAAVGTFGAVDERIVSIDVVGRGPSVLQPAPCAVSFHVDGRAAVFLSAVEAWRFGGLGLPRILVRLPDVIVVESRRFPRLVVPPDVGLVTRVTAEEQTWSARTLDLSVGGACVRFPPDGTPDLPPGTMVRLSFGWPYEDAFALSCLVVRRTESSYGFAFGAEVVRGTGPEAEKMRLLIRRLVSLAPAP